MSVPQLQPLHRSDDLPFPPSRPSTGWATAALVVGICAFVLGWVPLLGFALGVAGAWCACLALARRSARAIPVIALVLSVLAIAASTITTTLLVTHFSERLSASDEYDVFADASCTSGLNRSNLTGQGKSAVGECGTVYLTFESAQDFRYNCRAVGTWGLNLDENDVPLSIDRATFSDASCTLVSEQMLSGQQGITYVAEVEVVQSIDSGVDAELMGTPIFEVWDLYPLSEEERAQEMQSGNVYV